MANDFLDEMIAARTAKNPNFPRLVEEAAARRPPTRKEKMKKTTVCKKCGNDPKLSCTYDRHYCETCDVWIEYKPCNCKGPGLGCDAFKFPPDSRPSRCGHLDSVDAMCFVRNRRTKPKKIK